MFHMIPSILLNTSSCLLLVLLLVIAIYYALEKSSATSPPRFSILTGILRGRYDFARQGPMGLIRDGYANLGDIFRI